MSGETYAVFKKAIEEKLQVICIHNRCRRELCPHVLGIKDGKEQVLSYQFAGETTTCLPPEGEWRCMAIGDIENAETREGEWHTNDDHSQDQTCVDEIDVEVDY